MEHWAGQLERAWLYSAPEKLRFLRGKDRFNAFQAGVVPLWSQLHPGDWVRSCDENQ
jgi:hypothetical protein